MDKKNGHTPKSATTNITQPHCTSTVAQCNRLLTALIQQGAISTIYGREVLNIMAPPQRIFDLRAAGHQIITRRIIATDRNGIIHENVALYVLQKLAEGAA